MTYYFKRSQTGMGGINRMNIGVSRFKKQMRRQQRLKVRGYLKKSFAKSSLNQYPLGITFKSPLKTGEEY